MDRETLSAVLENLDLLRVIGEYLIGTQLPFILSLKAVREGLKPLNHVPGEKWIYSIKKYFVSSISMVEWAQSLGCEFNLGDSFCTVPLHTGMYGNIFTYAAFNGSVNVLKWLHQKYPPDQFPAGVNSNVCSVATMNGHLQVLEYLRSLGNIVQWSDDIYKYAAGGSHIHVLQWLREVLDPPFLWGVATCEEAAYHGHLHVLQWLRAQDPPCPWREHSCYCAAVKGHVDVLNWLRSQDPPCPVNEWTCSRASREGHLDILKWLRSQDPPCPWWRQKCINEARNNNHHEIVEWILSQPE